MLTETAGIKQNRGENAKPSQLSRVFLEVPGSLRRDNLRELRVMQNKDKLDDLNKTEENRELVKNFLHDVMQGKAPEKTSSYFDGDTYIQHNTGIADGLSGLGAALGALAEQGIQMIYDTIHQVLAQGNYVLAVSEGTFGGAPTSYYDLWRVENGKIAEHWDVMETIAEKNTWANQNGKF